MTTAPTLTPTALGLIRRELRSDGFIKVITAAVGPSERAKLIDDGFHDLEALHLLQRNLENLPPRPKRSVGIRRGTSRDKRHLPAIDQHTFEPFWQLDVAGIDEALRATPLSRLRVVRDPQPIAYAVAGRAHTQGYIQRLAVEPSHQGAGLGRQLVLDALHWFQRQGVTTCWVNTQESNTGAFAFYRRLGFSRAAHQLTVLTRSLA